MLGGPRCRTHPAPRPAFTVHIRELLFPSARSPGRVDTHFSGSLCRPWLLLALRASHASVSSTCPQRCEGCSWTCGVAPFFSMGLPDQPRTGLGDRQPPRAVPEGQSLSPWARGPGWEAWSPAFASGGRCPQDLVAAKRRHGPETSRTLPMTNSEKSERAGVPGDAQPGSGSRNESPDLAVCLRCFPGNE